tara:strand:+ start:1683 stop:2642 length:960 start_codon:yes stop_codon:yes gene_type:complete
VRLGIKKEFLKIFSQLSSQQKEDLNLMREDNFKSSFHYQSGPGKGWQKIASEFEFHFHKEGIKDVQKQFYNSRFASQLPGNRVYYYFACNFYYNNIKKRDKFGILRKLKKNQNSISPDVEVIIDDLIITWDILNAIHQIISIAEIDESFLSKKKIFLDLGAGWGRIGHLLVRINPKIIYVAADLPESLLISQNYLPKTLPSDTKIFSYKQNRLKLDFKDSGIYFIGSHHLEKVRCKTIDFLVNIASFQEMKNQQVKRYFSDFDRIVNGIFYTKQIRSSNYKDGFKVSGDNLYPYPKNWKKQFLRYPNEWPGYFEAAFNI